MRVFEYEVTENIDLPLFDFYYIFKIKLQNLMHKYANLFFAEIIPFDPKSVIVSRKTCLMYFTSDSYLLLCHYSLHTLFEK